MSERFEITFSEGGVGLIETLATGGLAVVAEKTMDAVSGNDNHGWYCTIKDTVTQISVKCWGPTEEEAEAKSREELKRKIEEAELRKRNEPKREPPSKTPTTPSTPSIPSTPSTNENGSLKIIIYSAIIIGVIAVAIWIAVNVVLPLILLNFALILTVLAIKFESKRMLFASLALVGGCYMLFDVYFGLLSLSFTNNVVKDGSWIGLFVFINAAALLLSSGMLITPVWVKAERSFFTNKFRSIIIMVLSIAFMLAMTTIIPVIYLLY